MDLTKAFNVSRRKLSLKTAKKAKTLVYWVFGHQMHRKNVLPICTRYFDIFPAIFLVISFCGPTGSPYPWQASWQIEGLLSAAWPIMGSLLRSAMRPPPRTDIFSMSCEVCSYQHSKLRLTNFSQNLSQRHCLTLVVTRLCRFLVSHTSKQTTKTHY